MECMVKVVKPFYAIKCIVGWLAGTYYMLGGGGGGGGRGGGGVMGVKMCWIQIKMGPLVRQHEMGLRLPHSC